MKKNKKKTPIKNKIKAKSRKTSLTKKAPAKTSASQKIKKSLNKSRLQTKAVNTTKKKKPISKSVAGRSVAKTKRESIPSSKLRRSSAEKSGGTQVEQRFKAIMKKKTSNYGSDGGGQVFDSHEYAIMPRVFGIDEPDPLDDSIAPEDTVSAMERAEEEDTIASGELNIPEQTEELAVGDGDEDSDEPTRISKPGYEKLLE